MVLMEKVYYVLISTIFYIGLTLDSHSVHGDPDCLESLTFENCKFLRKKVYRNQKCRIEVYYKYCQLMDFTYDFTIKNRMGKKIFEQTNNPDGPILYLKPYTFEPGTYYITAYVYYRNKRPAYTNEPCQLEIIVDPPNVEIDGGLQRCVVSKKMFIVDGSGSFDINLSPTEQPTLHYSWVYNYTGTEVISSTEKGPVLKFKRELVLPNNIFHVKMSVTTKKWGRVAEATQTIMVVDDAPAITIVCLSNCFRVTTLYEDIKFEAICHSNCHVLGNNLTWVWTVLNVNIPTGNVAPTSIFIIDPDFLESSESYIIEAKVASTISRALYKIETFKPLDLEPCMINPPTGESLKTKFKITNCNIPDLAYLFELVLVQGDGNETVIIYDSSLEFLEFMLPAHGEIILRATDGQMDLTYQKLSVDVKPQLDPHSDNEKEASSIIENIYYNKSNPESIRSLIQMKENDMALRQLSFLLEEINTMSNSSRLKTLTKWRKDIYRDLLKIPMSSMSQYQSTITILSKILGQTVEPPDSEAAQLSTRLCRYTGFKGLHLLMKTPDVNYGDIRTGISTLMKCSIIENKYNPDSIMGNQVLPPMTTDQPAPQEVSNVEQYPEYLDDENVYENRQNLKEAGINYMYLCNIGGSMALSMFTPSQYKDIIHGTVRLKVLSHPGSRLSREKINYHGIHIEFSQDFKEDASMYNVTVCTTADSPFWWDIEKEQILTNIVTLRILNVGKKSEVTSFEKPNRFTFNLHTVPDSNETILYGSTPPVTKVDPSEPFNTTHIATHIIHAAAGQTLYVEFLNLSDDDIFRVVLTDFRRPSMEDFKKSRHKITKFNNLIFESSIESYDRFFLIGIIPYKSTDLQQYHYDVVSYRTYCMQWREDTRSWENACQGSYVRVKECIECSCGHLSTLAATLRYNTMKDMSGYIPLEVVLELQLTYTICIVTSVLFLIYCILLSMGTNISEFKEHQVYLLSDVIYYSRYAYLLIVKTGMKLSSGTSANVTIILHGMKRSSKPHVLNYPDPGRELLQRNNEDWFVLATESHLGTLIEIEMWHDGVGISPSWYCSDIKICDIQTYTWYYFTVGEWFRFYPRVNIHLRIPRSLDHNKNLGRHPMKQLKKVLTPHIPLFKLTMSYTHDSFTYFKRLTVLLSIVITIALWDLFLYGIPKMTLTDTISDVYDFGLHQHVIVRGIISSAVSFAMHSPVIFIARNSRVQFSYDKRKTSHFSFAATIIIWIFLCINIMFSMTLLIVYGFWIPYMTAILWCTSNIIGILFYILVLETSFSILKNLTVRGGKNLNPLKRMIKLAIANIESQRLHLFRTFGKYSLRPYLSHLYEPLSKGRMMAKMMSEKLKASVVEVCENIIMFILYTTLLYILISGNRDSMTVLIHNQALNLINGNVSRSTKLSEVMSPSSFYTYLEESLIVATQSNTWYGKYIIKDAGRVKDGSNKILGIIRLRQHRVMDNSCDIIPIMEFLNKTCKASFSDNQSSIDLGIGWNSSGASSVLGRLTHMWNYQSYKKTGTYPMLGKLGYYPGGGYVAYLGRTMRNSLTNVHYMKKNSWIDPFTRCIFIEFLMYNVNHNMFSAVRIMIEKSAASSVRIYSSVKPTRLLYVNLEDVYRVFTAFILFIVSVAVVMIRTGFKIFYGRLHYFKNARNYIDLALIILSLTFIILSIMRSIQVRIFLKQLESVRHNEFINYFTLLRVEDSFSIVSALLICTAVAKLWGLLRFAVVFRIVERTLNNVVYALLGVLIYHTVIMIAFAFFAFLLLVEVSSNFSDLHNAIMSLFVMSLIEFDKADLRVLEKSAFGIGYLFFIMYIFMVLFITTIYMSMIIISYTEAREYYSQKTEQYTLKNYVLDQYAFYSALIQFRLKSLRMKAGADQKYYNTINPVIPKSEYSRYAHCLKLQRDRMAAMCNVARCILRNISKKTKHLKKNDFRLMTYTLYSLIEAKRKKDEFQNFEIFYTGNVGPNKVKLVPESRLKFIEQITCRFFGMTIQDILKRDPNITQLDIVMEDTKEQIENLNDDLLIILNSLDKINLTKTKRIALSR